MGLCQSNDNDDKPSSIFGFKTQDSLLLYSGKEKKPKKKVVIGLGRLSAIWSPMPPETIIREIKEILVVHVHEDIIVNLVLAFTWRGREAQKSSRLPGHEDDITNCVICPQDKYMISSSVDTTCRVWDLWAGKCLHVLQHQDPVIELRVSSSGQFVLSSTGESLYLWNIVHGELVKTFQSDAHVWCFDMTSDCLYLLTGCSDAEIVYIWSVLTGEIEGQMDVQPNSSKPSRAEGIRYLQIASNDETVLSTSGSLIFLWNLRSGKQNRILEGHNGLVNWCEFTYNIRFVASCGEDATVRIWGVRSGECLHCFQMNKSSIRCSFTPDSDMLVSCYDDHALAIWDVRTGKMLHQCADHDEAIAGFRVTQDGRFVCSWDLSNVVKKCRVADGRFIRSFQTENSISFCTITSDARSAVTNDSEFSLGVWNFENSRRASGAFVGSPE